MAHRWARVWLRRRVTGSSAGERTARTPSRSRPVHHGQPGDHPSQFRLLHAQRLRAVGPAGERVVDGEGLCHLVQGSQLALLEVGEVDDRAVQAQHLRAVGHGRRQVQGRVPRIGQELAQGAVRGLGIRHTGTPFPGPPVRTAAQAVSPRGEDSAAGGGPLGHPSVAPASEGRTSGRTRYAGLPRPRYGTRRR